MTKLTRLLTLLLMPLLLCSCWDYHDIDKRSVVLSVGVDYDRSTNNYIFSGEVANFSPIPIQQEGQSQRQGEGSNLFTFLSRGRTFEEAKLHSDSSVPNPMYLGAIATVILGTSFAEKSIEPYLRRIDSITDYRKPVLIVVSKESPEELARLNTNKAISVGSSVYNNLEWLEASGKAIRTSVGEMLSAIARGDVGYVLPYVGIQDNDIRYLGLAVMKNSRLVDVISIKDTNGLLYLLASKPVLVETMPGFHNPNNIFSIRSHLKKRKIKTEYIDNTPIINIKLDLNLELHYQYYLEPVDKKEIKQLEDSVSEKIQTDIETIITRSQKEFKSDIFNFSKYFKADFPKTYNAINWEEAYTTSKVNVKVSSTIINLDLDDPNAKIETLGDKNNE